MSFGIESFSLNPPRIDPRRKIFFSSVDIVIPRDIVVSTNFFLNLKTKKRTCGVILTSCTAYRNSHRDSLFLIHSPPRCLLALIQFKLAFFISLQSQRAFRTPSSLIIITSRASSTKNDRWKTDFLVNLPLE